MMLSFFYMYNVLSAVEGPIYTVELPCTGKEKKMEKFEKTYLLVIQVNHVLFFFPTGVGGCLVEVAHVGVVLLESIYARNTTPVKEMRRNIRVTSL